MLAKRTQAKVVPVEVVGAHVFFSKGAKRVQRTKVRVLFGPSLTYEAAATGETEQEKRENFISKAKPLRHSRENGSLRYSCRRVRGDKSFYSSS